MLLPPLQKRTAKPDYSGFNRPAAAVADFASLTLSIPAAVTGGSDTGYVENGDTRVVFNQVTNCIGGGSTLVSGVEAVLQRTQYSLKSAAGITFKSPVVSLNVSAGFTKHRFYGLVDFGIVSVTKTVTLLVPSDYGGCYPNNIILNYFAPQVLTTGITVTRVNFDAIIRGTATFYYQGENVGSLPISFNGSTNDTAANVAMVADGVTTFNSHGGVNVVLPGGVQGLTLASFVVSGLIDRVDIQFNIAYGQYSGAGAAFFAVESYN